MLDIFVVEVGEALFVVLVAIADDAVDVFEVEVEDAVLVFTVDDFVGTVRFVPVVVTVLFVVPNVVFVLRLVGSEVLLTATQKCGQQHFIAAEICHHWPLTSACCLWA